MENTFLVGGLAVFGLIVVITLAIIFAKLYKRATKSSAFVRTGKGGAKVIRDGGALVIPILHDSIQVNMNTLKLDVSRKNEEALITLDRMRVDVSAEFYVRVKPDDQSIETAAQTLGDKTTKPDELKKLVEGKFVDALRSVASSMTMKDLHEKRADFVNSVQQVVESDLKKNGLELESVSLTSFDQTRKEHFNADNAFDAEGLTRLTEQIEQLRKNRNDIEKDTELRIAQKNLETEKEQFLVRQNLETARLETTKELSLKKATQESEVAQFEAEQKRAADISLIEAEKLTETARLAKQRQVAESTIENEQSIAIKSLEKDRATKQASIEQQKQLELSTRDKEIALAKKSEEEAAAQASAEDARAKLVEATQKVVSIEEIAQAERRQQIEVINAKSNAQKESVRIVIQAEAEADAAAKKAQAVLTLAEAESKAEQIRAEGIKAKFEAEAEGQRKLNEAANLQSPELINLNIKTKLIENLPSIIRESVKPMEKIESIRIVDMGGVNLGNGASGVNAEGESVGSNGGSLPDQIVNASLKHKALDPLVSHLLDSVGLKDLNVSDATKNLYDGKNKK